VTNPRCGENRCQSTPQRSTRGFHLLFEEMQSRWVRVDSVYPFTPTKMRPSGNVLESNCLVAFRRKRVQPQRIENTALATERRRLKAAVHLSTDLVGIFPFHHGRSIKVAKGGFVIDRTHSSLAYLPVHFGLVAKPVVARLSVLHHGKECPRRREDFRTQPPQSSSED
jgi:hypothetical protein